MVSSLPCSAPFWLVGVALVISVPVGVAAAVYLSEYAPNNWFTRAINLAIINLAGVPSIVHALFGVGAFVLFFGFGTSILAASMTLAVMTLPVVIVATRESLQAVPHAFREACWNMGATRWQTIRRVVLPNSVSGILTGVILEVSRTSGRDCTDHVHRRRVLHPGITRERLRSNHGSFAASVRGFNPGAQCPRGTTLRCRSGPDLDGVADEQRLDSAAHETTREKEMVTAADNMSDLETTRKSASKLEVRNVGIRYGSTTAISGINLDVRENEIFGIIGPANAGKTSFLKALNRMNDFNTDMSVDGDILFEGTNIRDVRNVYALRNRIGVVFPLPVGLPLTVYENVAFVPRLRGITEKAELDVIIERCLTRAALWDEVKDRLDSLGSLLSGGQQQRLTIARALSQEPELLMLDEFSIAVDPVTTMRIEEVLKELKPEMSIILVTNLVQQARRLADRTAFFLDGECVEIGETDALFSGQVKDSRTTDYIEGRFG